MRTLITVLLFIVASMGGMIVVAYSGWYDVSARTSHTAPMAWFLATIAHNSVARRAAAIDVPDLEDESLILAGVNDYDTMCVDCHGAPGKARGAAGKGLNPRPPDLTEAADHMSAAELFWVTKNGIRMTGMPAWGVTHDDKALWPVVAFLAHRLPELDAEGYRHLLTEAGDSGHHTGDGEEDHDEHDHGDHRH